MVNAKPQPLYPWYPLYRRLGGPQGRFGRVQKIMPPPGFNPQTAQPIAYIYIYIYIHTHTHIFILYIYISGSEYNVKCLHPDKILLNFSIRKTTFH